VLFNIKQPLILLILVTTTATLTLIKIRYTHYSIYIILGHIYLTVVR